MKAFIYAVTIALTMGFGSTANDCYTCNSTYYKDLDSNTCGNNVCPDGQFKDSTNSPNVCVRCNI